MTGGDEVDARDMLGKTFVVTGAGGGIGSAVARSLAGAGANVALVDRSVEALDTALAQCRSYGGQADAFAMDQSDKASVDAALDDVVKTFPSLDGLFANAGYGKFGPFLGITARNWSRHVDVNLHGTFYVCHRLAEILVGQRTGGSIVINASSGAKVYSDQLFAYCVTKAALQMMATGMAAELGTHRIRVNSILPGVIETPMTQSMLADPRHRDVLVAETPIGRLGEPDDVAGLVRYLLSEHAAFINGAAIPIDGGQTIHGHPRWFRLDYSKDFNEDWEIPR
ncbi:MAG: short-chain dehydrogenase/reductase family protein [Frankiales bacterium]|nr:short-chain dehydrogenase/reductase family protein [Frankiales bacterium]